MSAVDVGKAATRSAGALVLQTLGSMKLAVALLVLHSTCQNVSCSWNQLTLLNAH